jgi:hypothetical protein
VLVRRQRAVTGSVKALTPLKSGFFYGGGLNLGNQGGRVKGRGGISMLEAGLRGVARGGEKRRRRGRD